MLMSRVRSHDTGPELIVRRMLFKAGHRYRKNDKRLPGSPDVALWPERVAIFVHGCFWHQHSGPCDRLPRLPKSNREYWLPKLNRNKARDAERLADLERLGWRVIVIWECEVSNTQQLATRLEAFIRDAQLPHTDSPQPRFGGREAS